MPRKKEYTVQEAFEYLNERGITNSIQVVRRWLNEGKLKGYLLDGKRSKGYRILSKDLNAFVKQQGTTKTMEYLEELKAKDKEIEHLNTELQKAKKEISTLKDQIVNLSKIKITGKNKKADAETAPTL